MKNKKRDLKSLKNRIFSSHFLKSVLTLSSGIVIAQIINFIGMPVIGRLYSPGAIGDYTLITANSAVISTIVCLGMMTALIIPDSEEESKGLCKIVSISTVLLTTLIIVVLYLIAPLYKIFSTEETSYTLSLLVLWAYIIFNMIYNVCYAYANRLKMYKVMFWNPIIGASISMGLGILFGFFCFGFLGYVAAYILSFIANIVHLLFHANPYHRERRNHIKFVELIKQYRQFPIFQMPANLIANIGMQMPVWMISNMYSSSALGMYSMALRILALPSTLLATPINRVYFQEASQRYNRGEDIGEFSFKIIETNNKIALIPILILIVFGRLIFGLFLGSQWAEAGSYASLLGVYQLMLFCNSCLSGDFVIIKKNSWNLISSIITLAVQCLVFIFCKWIHPVGIYGFLMIFSTVMILKIIAVEAWFFKYLNFSLKRYALFLVKYIIAPLLITDSIFIFLW